MANLGQAGILLALVKGKLPVLAEMNPDDRRRRRGAFERLMAENARLLLVRVLDGHIQAAVGDLCVRSLVK